MPIMPNTNLESDKLIGHIFPKDDEDTFLADAAENRRAAVEMYNFVEDLENKRATLAQALQGDFGTKYQENLTASIAEARKRAEEFDFHASALEAAASNIAAAKLNMNAVDRNFHENMAGLQDWSFENGIPQHQVVEERDAMFSTAVSDIASVDKNLASSQDHVVEALENGTPINPSSLVSLAADAETSAAVLPAVSNASYASQGSDIEIAQTISSPTSFTASAKDTIAVADSEFTLTGSNSLLSGISSAIGSSAPTAAESSRIGNFNGGVAGGSVPGDVTGAGTSFGVGTPAPQSSDKVTTQMSAAGVPSTVASSSPVTMPTAPTVATNSTTSTAPTSSAPMSGAGVAGGVAGAPTSNRPSTSKSRKKKNEDKDALETRLSAGDVPPETKLSADAGSDKANVDAPVAASGTHTTGAAVPPAGTVTSSSSAPLATPDTSEQHRLIAAGGRVVGVSTSKDTPVTLLSAGGLPTTAAVNVEKPVTTAENVSKDNVDAISGLDAAVLGEVTLDVLKDLDTEDQKALIVGANVWSGIALQGKWEGEVAVAIFENSDKDLTYVYSTEHALSYLPATLDVVDRLIPLDILPVGPQFVRDNLSSDPVARLKEAENISEVTNRIGHISKIVVAGTHKEYADAHGLTKSEAAEIATAYPLHDGYLSRDTVSETKDVTEQAFKYVNNVEGTLGSATLALYMCDRHTPEYSAALSDVFTLELRRAVEEKDDVSVEYLVKQIQALEH